MDEIDIGSAVRSVGIDRRPLIGKLVGWAPRDAKGRRIALIEPFGARYMASRVGSWRLLEPLTPPPSGEM